MSAGAILTEKFNVIALSYGALTLGVVIVATVARVRRGRIMTKQFCVALVLMISWILSNVAFVALDRPTSNDLAFPYIDLGVASGVILVAVANRRIADPWMTPVYVSSILQLLFHTPYLMTGGEIMSKYAYHLTLNLIFLFQNVMILAGIVIKRSQWLAAGRKAWDWTFGRPMPIMRLQRL